MGKLKALDSKERYSLRLLVEELKEYRGRGTQLISLYIPPSKRPEDVTSYLRDELSESSNIKSKSTRKNVSAALESILSRLKMVREIPENGLVFFVGHHDVGADQTDMTQNVLDPPLPITTFLYRCDSEFYLEQIEDMLASDELYGLIVVDRSEGTIGLIRGSRIETITNIPSRVPSKHGKGGQSARRFERLIENAAHEFFKKIGARVDQSFLNEENLKGILVGGPGNTKDHFIERDYINHELKKKVIGTFNTGYTNEYGLKELTANASTTLEQVELFHEKKMMERFFKEVRKSRGGLSAYGPEQVRKALIIGAVDTLLISDDIRMDLVEYECADTGEKRIAIMDKKEELETCQECGGEIATAEREDLVKYLSREAQKVGSGVEFISANSEEGDMLVKAFGGVAGILRYPLNL